MRTDFEKRTGLCQLDEVVRAESIDPHSIIKSFSKVNGSSVVDEDLTLCGDLGKINFIESEEGEGNISSNSEESFSDK